MKNDVKQVLLSATATRTDTGYLLLQYSFENRDACEAELRSLSKSVL